MVKYNIQPENSLSERRKKFFSFFALFILVLVTYSNTFDVPWHFDDTSNILKNKPLHLSELSIENIKNTFFASYDGKGRLYRPIACFSFALNYYLHGENVFGYHIVNFVTHVLSACFLFLFIYYTLNLTTIKTKFHSNAYFIALLSTAFWAVNPVQSQAVTYVVQRMTSMAGLFSIMSMYFYLKARVSVLKNQKMLYFAGCCLFGALALGSKENTIMLPVTLLIYDLILIEGISKNRLKKYAFFTLLVLCLCIVVALLLAGPSLFSFKNLVSSYHNRGFNLTERLLTEPRVILFYISLLLYPMPDRLCLEHGITLSTGLFTPISTLFSIVAILLMLGAAILYTKRAPLISFCTIFFFLNHLVESSVLPLELIFEHRNYFPSILFFVPFVVLIQMTFFYFSRRPLFQFVLSAFVILILVGWGHSTYIRNAIWRTHKSLLLDCVTKDPELHRPHHNLAVYYEKNNMLGKAISEYLTALKMENSNNQAARNWTYYNLGTIYRKLHQDEKALNYYNQAQKYNPNFAPTHVGKGLLFMRKGKYKEAKSSFLKAIKSDPARASAYGNLGFLSLLAGSTDEAIKWLKMAVMKKPKNAKAMRHLGIAYELKGDTIKAFVQFKKSVSIEPNDLFTLLNLATIYDEKGMTADKNKTITKFFAVLERAKMTIQRFKESLKSKPGVDDFLAAHRKRLIKTLEKAQENRNLKNRAKN